MKNEMNRLQDFMNNMVETNEKQHEHFELLRKKTLAEMDYNKNLNKCLSKQIDSTLKIVKMQAFSQKMVENLINDLMDLAKMDNNQFQINSQYFNLTHCINEAFHILKDNAKLNKVKLRAQI